jgi:hypothetical protein
VQEGEVTGRAAAIVLALALNPAPLHAQDVVFSVSVSSADVHKGPSIATPVIGHVSRGTDLPVSRNLGSWIKVQWPDGPDGFGYLHVTTGQLAAPHGNGAVSKSASRSSSTATAASSLQSGSITPGSLAPMSASSQIPMQTAKPPRTPRERVAIRQQGSTPITHVVGIGGLFGSTSSFGATARLWRDNGLGLQIGFSRDTMTSSVAAGRVSSVQLEPAVVYGLFDHVSDYFWIHPYVGAGLSVRHQSLEDAPATGTEPASSTGMGYRAFGGSEVTFAGAPRFALSADAGYRHAPTPFAGFEPSTFSVFVLGHWYIN